MEEITQEQADKMIKQGEEEIAKIIEEGGKVTKTVIEEKDKTTTIIKIEPVNGKGTSSTTIQTKDGIETNYSFIE